MNAQIEMPRYQSHKQVHALKIAEIHYHGDIPNSPQAARLRFEDDRFASIDMPLAWASKHDPKAGGYLVVYEDGYKSFSPAEAFESGYTQMGGRSAICSPETNFCWVFELPLNYPEKYCFGGGVPVEFQMVGWFNTVSDSMQKQDWETEVAPMLREFVTAKPYIRQNRNYLLVTDFGKVIFFANPRPAKLG